MALVQPVVKRKHVTKPSSNCSFMANEWRPLLIHAQLVVVGPIPIRHSSGVTGTERASITNPIGFMTFLLRQMRLVYSIAKNTCKGHLLGMQEKDSGGTLLDAPWEPHNLEESEQQKYD